MAKPKILAFSGSVGRTSLNANFVRAAIPGASAAGAEVRYVALADYAVPVFTKDLEAEIGMHENARAFKALMMDHHGFLISMPEYNGSVPGGFKNLIDWVSRTTDGHPGNAAFAGKFAAFLSASGGQFGAVRSLDHARYIFNRMGATVVPQHFPLNGADKLFDAEGRLTDDKVRKGAEAIGRALAEVLAKMA
jgi:NAD(P)H-dependent FMN reductase